MIDKKPRASALLLLLLLCGCNDMGTQPKQQTYSPRAGPAATPADTVEYASRPEEAPSVTPALLLRGQDRYRIYCTPCHSELGDGHGMIVQRGFPPPPSFHTDRLRAVSPQHLYDVITGGFGVMYPFADRIESRDRWAIAAYIRALQRSQDASLADLPAGARAALQ